MSGIPPALIDAPPLHRFGFPELVEGTTPAATTDYTAELKGNYRYRLLSVFCRIVTTSDVADRNVVVEYRDGGNNRFMLSGAPVAIEASTTIDLAFDVWQSQAEWPVDGTILVPLKPLILPPTFDFRIHVENIQTGDALSRIRYVWELFSTDSPTPGALGM